MLLTVSNIHKGFATDTILDGASFRIDVGEKVAMVGRNGAGKSTLLKIVIGEMEPDTGSVSLVHGAKIGYLRQEAPIAGGRTVLEEAQDGVRDQLELKDRLAELEAKLDAGPTQDDLDEYALLHEHFAESGGYSAANDVRTVLKQLGFEEEEFDKKTSALSGGEKTRLALARLLLQEPDLLILDEPTNHLDLQATEWLERWIVAYRGAVLLVSHDRFFLEATCQRVLEIEDQKITAWPGPYSHYRQLKADYIERQKVVARRQENEIAKLDEFVRRFMNSQRTAEARGRLKMKEKLEAQRVVVRKEEGPMKAAIGEVKRSGTVVIEAKKLAIGFKENGGEVALFRNLDWTVEFGDRWGVIGENGAGKSTLIKVALGLQEPLAGEVRIGSSVEVGYFSQDASHLDGDDTPLDVLVYECNMSPEDGRKLLGRFLIEGDDAFRPIRTFSGGEKNKIALARLAALKPNLLVLDEPTNHLDMASREALADVLKDYGGTLVLISHDRWLLGQTAQEILDVRKAGAVQFPGGYEDYRIWTASGKPLPGGGNSKQKAKAVEAVPAVTTLSPRELSKEIQRMDRLVAEMEGQVDDCEKYLKEIESQLSNLPANADVLALSLEHSRAQSELEAALNGWEEASRKFEELKETQGRSVV